MIGFLKQWMKRGQPPQPPQPRRAVTFQVKCVRCGVWGKAECEKCWQEHEREEVFSFGAERGFRL